MGRLSKEEYLLGWAKHNSNVYPNNQGDLPGSSNDKDVPHERTRRMGARKYLRKNCYHRIECPAANFLAVFMWRRLLNSVTLATTTHRRSERVSVGTSTRVMTQIINKCRIKIVQSDLYNVWDPPWIEDQKYRERKDCSNLNCISNMFNQFILELTSSNHAKNEFGSILLAFV